MKAPHASPHRAIYLDRFLATGHGMYEFVQKPNGSRQNTRITDGYFRLLSDWIRQQDKPPYGSGQRIH
jgi:hypothetical protein